MMATLALGALVMSAARRGPSDAAYNPGAQASFRRPPAEVARLAT
jgi:hypothetical protein